MSTRLIQKLLQEIETTFTPLLNRECLALAAHMLCTQPQRAVSEVALCSGFNDISHFNHLFRRQYGSTPTAYRAVGTD